MSIGQDQKYIDDFDGTQVYSPTLPEGWLEVDPDGQHYLKHPNMPKFRDQTMPGRGDGALGIFNPFNLNLGGDSFATSGKDFVEAVYGMYAADLEHWRLYALDKVADFQAKIAALKALWDARPWPVAAFTGSAVYGLGNPPNTYTDTSTGGGPLGITEWRWEPQDGQFRNGTSAASQNPDIEWLSAGDKLVSLTVTDEYGRQSTTTLTVVVS
jgi:PKD repeat protein